MNGRTEPDGFWDDYDPDVAAERWCEECSNVRGEGPVWCPECYLARTGDDSGAARLRAELEMEMAS